LEAGAEVLSVLGVFAETLSAVYGGRASMCGETPAPDRLRVH
jgi:hypothetical protein